MAADPDTAAHLFWTKEDDATVNDLFSVVPQARCSSHCLLPSLRPARQCLHLFLTTKDAMRLMQTGRSVATSVLSGYAIRDQKHALSYRHRTPAEVKQSIALYTRYGIRILAMCLPESWTQPLVDAETGRSVLPPSLIALTLGSLKTYRRDKRYSAEVEYQEPKGSSSLLSALFIHWSTRERWQQQTRQATEEKQWSANNKLLDSHDMISDTVIGSAAQHASSTDVEARVNDPTLTFTPTSHIPTLNTAPTTSDRWSNHSDMDEACTREWDVCTYSRIHARFDQFIVPGDLPRGLRLLQFGSWFNKPLHVGSIPNTVNMLQFGDYFNQRLAFYHLPASLTHLNFGHFYNEPLLPGVLPAGLKRLHLGVIFNHPLLPGVLPPRLQQLSFGCHYNHPLPPGVIPSSVHHLRLSRDFNQPLHIGSIPEGVRHLQMGGVYNQKLLPGVLPSSLHELVISWRFNQPLQPGSLPDGLEILIFDTYSNFQKTQPCTIPASVAAISMGLNYTQELVAGGIPSTVKWLRLPPKYVDRSGVLSPSTHVLRCYCRLRSMRYCIEEGIRVDCKCNYGCMYR